MMIVLLFAVQAKSTKRLNLGCFLPVFIANLQVKSLGEGSHAAVALRLAQVISSALSSAPHQAKGGQPIDQKTSAIPGGPTLLKLCSKSKKPTI